MTTGLEIDVALFMVTVGAAAVNVYYLPQRFAVSTGVAIARCLRLAGWLILSARFGHMLISGGDIPISIPGVVAFFFLALGEIAAIFNRGKEVRL